MHPPILCPKMCFFFLTPIQYGKPIMGVSILNLTGWFWQEIAYMSRHICKERKRLVEAA